MLIVKMIMSHYGIFISNILYTLISIFFIYHEMENIDMLVMMIIMLNIIYAYVSHKKDILRIRARKFITEYLLPV